MKDNYAAAAAPQANQDIRTLGLTFPLMDKIFRFSDERYVSLDPAMSDVAIDVARAVAGFEQDPHYTSFKVLRNSHGDMAMHAEFTSQPTEAAPPLRNVMMMVCGHQNNENSEMRNAPLMVFFGTVHSVNGVDVILPDLVGSCKGFVDGSASMMRVGVLPSLMIALTEAAFGVQHILDDKPLGFKPLSTLTPPAKIATFLTTPDAFKRAFN